jgi:hypothetical protein
MKTKTFKRCILFTEERKERLLALRDRLSYLSNGLQAEIAKSVGCTRQTVHNVLYAYDDDLAAKSDYAYNVWKELEAAMADPTVVEEFETMRTIVEGLRKGSVVKLEMPLPKFRLIKRKLDKLGVKYTLDKSRGWPNVYTLKSQEPRVIPEGDF